MTDTASCSSAKPHGKKGRLALTWPEKVRMAEAVREWAAKFRRARSPATPEVAEKVEFLIDSGAIYSVVPAPVLERLGIKPLAEKTSRLADGSKIVRKKGVAVFRRGERAGGADVIFGEEGDSTLLGAFTLEALGLSLDPLRRELSLCR